MTVTDPGRILRAFGLEARALSHAMEGLSDQEWKHPTRCAPWTVRELLAHVRMAIAWLPGMLKAPEPDRAQISAAEHYRSDDRFSPPANAARIAQAQHHVTEMADGTALATDFAELSQRVERTCRAEPAHRVVSNRHGDAMFLSDFLLTRVLELAIHGLDLADALERESWLTEEAETAICELMLGPEWLAVAHKLRWEHMTLLRKATGRATLDTAEVTETQRTGIRPLTLG
ncbi:maleylpyruvate isomerase N-terminal domain-containing protein [Streptomyces sp. NPDC054854]